MQIQVTIDLFVGATQAFGEVSGVLDLAAVPPVGSHISLIFPNNGTMPVQLEGFSGILKVVDVRFTPQSLSEGVAIKLEDIVLKSSDDARSLVKFLERGYGMEGEDFEEKS